MQVPFIVYNVPEVDSVVTKWTQDYISNKFGDQKLEVTKSNSNHFMVWRRCVCADVTS